MQSLYFWKSWAKEYRLTWLISAGIFAATIIFLWISYFKDVDGVIHWDKLQEQKVVETTVHTFKLGPFELNVPAESYVIFEYFHGSAIQPNTIASYFFLTIMIVGCVMLLSVVTTLEKFWFYVGMALFILFVVSLRLEVIGLFGQFNQIPVVAVLMILIGPAFYINRFAPSTPFLIRLASFTLITMVIGVLITFFSSVELPLYHLTLTSYIAGLVLSLIFILTIAHELFALFVYVVSQGKSKSLQHFFIISIIYLVNLFIAAFHEMGTIDWKFLYLNVYLLLSLSAVIGIWGFRERESLYGNIISFSPFGAYFFLALGAICFATVGQLLISGNDPAVMIIRHAVIFSHTGYGVVFVLYLISNFVLMLGQNIPINKVLYKPTRMPYFTYRLAGLIATLAFIFVSDWQTYVYNGMSGFYNYTGDLYTLLGDDKYAEAFYEQGRSHSFMNHRSNYALAIARSSEFNMEAAHESYEWANSKNPSAYSLANAGNIYLWEKDYFGAIEAYGNATRKLPGSGVIENNFGLALSKIHNLDSALGYFDKARQHAFTKETAETNFFGMVTLERIPLEVDSVMEQLQPTSTATLANAVALSILYNKPFTTPINPLQKKLNLFSATLLNNYMVKYAKEKDTAFIAQAYRIASDPANTDYSEALKASIAFAYYYQGNVRKALEILGELVYITQDYKGKFNYTMGLWALEQGNPELASTFFTYADTDNYKDAKFYNAIALTEAGRTQEAYGAWQEISVNEQAGERAIAENLKKILIMSIEEVLTLGDPDKYQFCRYRLGVRDSLMFNRIVNTFENPNFKAQALLDMTKRYYEVNQYKPAIHYFNRIAGLELTDRRLYDDVRHTELRMLASRGELRSLANQINKGITFDQSRSLEKLLYTALLSESAGDTTSAQKSFEILGTYNPYFEEGILAAANFFRNQNPNDLKAYTILAEAIQINNNSYRLLEAYVAEAARKEFDEYAASALQRLEDLSEK